MKSEKGWNPEKKKKNEKRREVRKEESVGREVNDKKNDRKDSSTANTAEMLPLTFAQKKKKKAMGHLGPVNGHVK